MAGLSNRYILLDISCPSEPPMLARLVFTVCAWLAVTATTPAWAQTKAPVVFAAASMKESLDAVIAARKAAGVGEASVSYAASSALAKQIESGAPADLFVSADLDWMDWLAERKLIQPATRATLLANRLVLIGPSTGKTTLVPSPHFKLADALGADGRLALGDTRAVPAGKYAKAALETYGVWSTVANRTAEVESVRAALALVSRGEAPLGIVYATDAAAEPKVRTVGLFPEDSHPPIRYPAALTASAALPDAAKLLDFMRSSAAKPIWERYGFTVLSE
jgi:molybdate transport system substrate-binding protein